MADKLISSTKARDVMRAKHDELSAEFDKSETDPARKHEINGEMASLRWSMREVEKLPSEVAKATE